MELLEVHLISPDPLVQRLFYAEVLGLPVTESSLTRLCVQVGQTRLSFEAGAALPGPYHLAFDVPEHRFGEACTWLTSRLPLLSQDGESQFFSRNWNAEMVYFTDPHGNILELIARHTLPRPDENSPGPTLLLNVSEVGVAVSDVRGTLQALHKTLGVGSYLEGSERFAPAGTHGGLLIVVAEGRHWFPTDQTAVPLPTWIVAQTAHAGQITLPDGPVQIIGVRSPESRTLDPICPSG